MIVAHTVELRCRCPVEDRADYYEVEITLDRVLLVDELRKVLALHADKKALQEEITKSIAGYLGAKVVTRGQHSEFRTVCTVDCLDCRPPQTAKGPVTTECRRLVYLASPYTHSDSEERQRRYEAVRDVAAILIKAGCTIFAPIVMLHPIAVAHGLPIDWEYWRNYDRVMLERCQALLIVTVDGWRESVGVQAEVAIATELGIPIGYLENYRDEVAMVHFARRSGLIDVDMQGRAWGEPTTY